MENNYTKEEVIELLELAWATASAYGDKTNSKDCADWIDKNLPKRVSSNTELEMRAKELYRALDLMTQVFWPNGEAELGYAQNGAQAFAFVALEQNRVLELSKEDRKIIQEKFKPLKEAKFKEFEEIAEKVRLWMKK